MPSSACKKRDLRSEEHTSELQSHDNLVCRLLLEKKCPEPMPAAAGPAAGRRRARSTRRAGGRGARPAPRGVRGEAGFRGGARSDLFFLKGRPPPRTLPLPPAHLAPP